MPGLGSSPASSQQLVEQKDQASGFIYSLVGSGAEKRGNRETFRYWRAAGFSYGLPSYHIGLQKENFGKPYFNTSCSLQRKHSPIQEVNFRGVLPARRERRVANNRQGAASAPLPEVSACFQARAHIPVPGTLLAGASAPRRRGHTVQPAASQPNAFHSL